MRSFLEEHGDIVLAFAFGSAAANRAREDSDWDIAVWLEPPGHPERIAVLSSQLEELLHRRVDVVRLNTAPPAIAWSALQGTLLVSRDERLRLRLLLSVSAQAEDDREFTFDWWRWRQRVEAARGPAH